jgi:di/tricarboxylate transporter
MLEQLIVFAVLLASLVLFVWGRWRYDIVALLALLVVTVTGIIDYEAAFMGFANSAVITVAAVLVISRCLLNTGVVDLIGGWVSELERPVVQVAVLSGLVTLLSGFINNVGALALMMPVGVQLARKHGRSPSYLLMPLAFGSILGGMMTLIGTPSNLIIAEFRTRAGGAPFAMFDFTPVGLGVAAAGLIFISLLGWRLIPKREGQASREELFQVKEYLTEVRVPEGARAVGKMVLELIEETDADVVVLRLTRGDEQELAPMLSRLQVGDVLAVEADSAALKALIDTGELALEGNKEQAEAELDSGEITLAEVIVMSDSPIEGRSARSLNLRWRYGINLLAVARQGARLKQKLSDIRFQRGDILLLQLPEADLQDALTELGCLPLAERGLRLAQPRRIALSLGIFGIGVVLSALGWLSAAVAFTAVAVVMVLLGLIPLKRTYSSIDWSVIVLLGAFIPVGQALESSGGAALISEWVLSLSGALSAPLMLTLMLVVTTALSNLINNAAAAILMAPVGLSVASGLGANPDTFLMAIVIGASCAFLTPVGHQSNTLVMGPGGYKFGDYWRMGLALELLIIIVAIPLLLIVWPLQLSS